MSQPNDNPAAVRSDLFVDRPPRDDLPREMVRPSTPREILQVVIGTILLMLCANTFVTWYLDAHPVNRGYWIVREKWERVERTPPVEWLILGDSSCNQGIVPAVWNEEMSTTSLNLCTVGDLGLLDDVWLLERYAERHGAPNDVLIVHVYDVWHRDPEVALIGQIRRPWGFWSRRRPALELDFEQWRTVFWTRYFPVYAQNASLKRLVFVMGSKLSLRPLFARRYEMTPEGYMPWREAASDRVVADAARHLEFASEEAPKLSASNLAALRRLGEFSEEHGTRVHLMTSPVYEGLVRDDGFRAYVGELNALLREQTRSFERVTVHDDLFSYRAVQMQNADHLVDTTARLYTRRVASIASNTR